MPLYGLIWLVLLEFFTLMLAPRGNDAARYLHVGLGLAILGLAFVNLRNVEATTAPARTKRIAKIGFRMTGFAALTGFLLFFGIAPSLGILRGGAVYALHLTAVIALTTMAASTATSFDMWEEKEFEHATAAGEPAPPRPAPTPHA
jgi:hypothetical protein